MNAPMVTKPDDTSLMIRRTFDVDAMTFRTALTDPKAWMQWFGGGVATPVRAEADLKVGGAWLIESRGNETGTPHNVGGEFVEVDPPKRVSFTWAWYSTPGKVSQVTYAVSATEDGKATLTLTHQRLADTEARDNHGRGWTATLERLAAHLEG